MEIKRKTDKRWLELFGHYSDRQLAKFKVYHTENPHIYKRFRELAEEMRKTGRGYYSSKMLINVIRWETDLRGGDEFKINDKYQSLYGRLLAFNEPTFEEFFQFRKRTKGVTDK